MSARAHRRATLLSGLILVAGVVAFAVTRVGDTGMPQAAPLSN